MDNFSQANKYINDFAKTIAKPRKPKKGKKVYTGVDLGTAYIVLAVVDEDGKPVAGALEFAEVVKDGLVVDYNGAMRIVKRLKQKIEEDCGVELETAGVAFPPGTGASDCRAIRYIAEAQGFKVEYVMDEPTAANNVLAVENGAVVDIGGGTTGVAIFENGQVIFVDDEPSGGTHFSLVIAGAKGIPFLEAEELKKDKREHRELLPIVRPVIEKVGSIVGRCLQGHPVDTVYLVGGTCCFENIEKVIASQLGVKVVKPDEPMWVTPLGIALGAMRQAQQKAAEEHELYYGEK